MEPNLLICKCGSCNHNSKGNCIEIDCPCCGLEDTFTLLTQIEFVPHSKMQTHSQELSLTA